MADTAVILDCYTVEPSGLGVPPYISTYVRDAYSAVRRALPDSDVRYLTIDDVRWCINGGEPLQAPPLSDSSTYSATTNRADTLELIADADVVVVIAGDRYRPCTCMPRTVRSMRSGTSSPIFEADGFCWAR